MKIAPDMSLEELMKIMGDYPSAGDALVMRSLLVNTGYEKTDDVQEPEWQEMLNKATSFPF